MADNTVLNAGTGGDTIATDDVAGVKYQYVKLADGTADSSAAIPGSATDGLLVNLGANNDVTVTGVSTLAEQQTQTTSLQLLDDAVYASDAALNKTIAIGAVLDDAATVAITENQAGYLRMSSRRALLVEGVASGTVIPVSLTSTTITGTVTVDSELPAAAAISAENTAAPTAPSIYNFPLLFDGTNWDRAPGTSADGALVNLGTNNDVTVTSGAITETNSGAALTALQLIDDAIFVDDTATHATGTTKGMGIMAAATPTDTAVNANDIGMVGMTNNREMYVSLRDISGAAAVTGSGAATGALRVEIANNGTGVLATLGTVTTVSTLTGGGVAHGAGDSGNPLKIGAKVETSLESVTLAADGNRTDLYADSDGVQMVKLYCPLGDVTQERVSNTDGASTAFTNFGAVASVRNYITTIAVFNTSATDAFIDLRDGTAGSVIFTIPAPKGGGSVITFPVPLRQPTVNTALAFDPSAAITTLYISLVGFQSKV